MSAEAREVCNTKQTINIRGKLKLIMRWHRTEGVQAVILICRMD